MNALTDQESVVDTEAALLAASIRREDVRELVLAAMNSDWFVDLEHRKIFEAIKQLQQTSSAIDATTIYRTAREGRASLLDVPLTEAWVFKSAALGMGITGESVTETHLPFLRSAYQMREYEGLSFALTEKVSRAESPADVAAWLNGQLERISQDRSADVAISDSDAIFGLIQEANNPEPMAAGFSVGIDEFDSKDIKFYPRLGVCIAARPSHGKTSLGMEMSLGISSGGIGVVYFALEDGVAGWQDRRAMMLTDDRPGLIRAGTAKPRTYDFLGSYVTVSSERGLPLWVIDNDRSYTAYDIIATLRRMKRKNPMLGAFFIDQCYDISGWQDNKRGEGRDMAPNRIIGELIAGARELDLCPIFLQQMNRGGDKSRSNEEPTSRDLADSDVFFKKCRTVLMLWRPHFDEPQEDIDAIVKIAKNTHGPRSNVEMEWYGPRIRIGGFRDPFARATAEALKKYGAA